MPASNWNPTAPESSVNLPTRNLPPGQRDDRARLKGDMAAGAKGIPLKLVFGSDFPYRETETHIPWRGQGTSVRPSLALGGLSNVWGATLLPYREADIADWPIKSAQLEKHYRAVLELTGLSAQHDDLEEWFPLHCDQPHVLECSPAGQAAAS